VRYIRQFYCYYLSPDKGLARRLREILGFTPTRLSLYRLAFFHKSNNSTGNNGGVPPPTDKPGGYRNNERLEYLGDAVLGTIVAEYLFKKYPLSDEGFLTKMRSKIVKRETLNKISEDMGLDVILAEYNNTRLSQAMLGNAFEALIGAIYLELGYHKTRSFIIARILRKYVDIHQLETFDDNYKSQLLEWSQKNGKVVAYKLIAKYKFEKRDRFKIAVTIDGEKIATADDFNKKSAEQFASEKAIQILGIKLEEEV
jgi:ribonuclease III